MVSKNILPQNAQQIMDVAGDSAQLDYVIILSQFVKGKWLNTKSDPIREGKSVLVRALRDIAAGEEIYTTYNHCIDCESRLENYGTPELLRDYGFVESYPQRWVFSLKKSKPTSRSKVVSFDLDLDETAQVKLTWSRDPPPGALLWLKSQLKELKDAGELELEKRDTSIPDNEWDTIMKYYNALTVAFTEAIKALESAGMGSKEDDCTVDGTCDVSDRYNPLTMENEEWYPDRPGLCDYHEIYGLNQWHTKEQAQSHYQKILFLTIPKFNNNVCFDLDGTVQVCVMCALMWIVSSPLCTVLTLHSLLHLSQILIKLPKICEAYRPHYHEPAVHYTARFMKDVKRVMFVGGGDSMLLHEILKYPTLEKVVGLELDQQVTRSSFKHFGTQPHWDNERVEWWFGDATKSLLILPEDYFGSFDMVLVDLSETVMALTVTGELDVMQALTLLLKPTGILLKNEIMYFPEMSGLFPYSLHVHFYDVPIVCSQSLVLGSKNVDFLKSPVYNHDVEYFYKLLDEDRHTIIHDFQHNITAKSFCRKDSLDEPTEQEKSPGIIMIVDADEATIDLSDREKLEGTVINALSSVNTSVVKVHPVPTEDSSIALVFILKEGYIIAHAYSEMQYCGFDIHLWSSLEKQGSIKKVLVESIGSNVGIKSSAYRIVAGGMFGTSNWQEEQKHLGPLAAAPKCTDSKKAELLGKESKADQDALAATFKGVFNLLSKDKLVAVVCGTRGQTCNAVHQLEAAGNEVIPLWSCPDISDGVAFEKDGTDRMYSCQKELHHLLKRTLNEQGKKLDAIVLDLSTNYAMGQILNEMFSIARNMNQWLNKENITAISLLPDDDSSWRTAFVEMIRTDVVIHEPVFTTEVHFKKSTKSFGLVITAAGNEGFLPQIVDTLGEIEKVTGYTGSIERVRGGELVFQDEFDPPQFFSHKEYDNQDAQKQWHSQKQVGFQVVFQFEGEVSGCLGLKKVLVDTMVELEVETKDELFTDVVEGEGCIILSYWEKGFMLLLWDGRKHVDVNMYVYEEDWDFVGQFEDGLEDESELELSLRDIQPRGPGRVVMFPGEVDEKGTPAWVTQ